jgi:hypothetical protein
MFEAASYLMWWHSAAQYKAGDRGRRISSSRPAWATKQEPVSKKKNVWGTMQAESM